MLSGGYGNPPGGNLGAAPKPISLASPASPKGKSMLAGPPSGGLGVAGANPRAGTPGTPGTTLLGGDRPATGQPLAKPAPTVKPAAGAARPDNPRRKSLLGGWLDDVLDDAAKPPTTKPRQAYNPDPRDGMVWSGSLLGGDWVPAGQSQAKLEPRFALPSRAVVALAE